MSRPATFVLAAQKGGVGKTTTTVELAAGLRRAGCDRILVIDSDPSANATRRLGVDEPEYTLNDVMQWVLQGTGTIDQAISATPWSGIDVVASEKALKFREGEGGDQADYRLQIALEQAGDALDLYDAILIDTIPSGGPLLRNAMVAADYAFVLTDPESDGLNGAVDAVTSVENIAKRQNPQLRLLGILVNRFDMSVGEHKRCVEDLTATYDELVWRPWIPERAAVKTARGLKRSVELVPGTGSREYRTVMDQHAQRVITTLGGQAA
jgi:chromosome partitioning protein